jgi:aryl-alcohol dehydrogenase-like predicted oxidoreductase
LEAGSLTVAMWEMVQNTYWPFNSSCKNTNSVEETAFDCLKAAYDAGVNFFDTAETYSGGQSEVVLGEAIKKFGWKQNDLVISTKVSTFFSE